MKLKVKTPKIITPLYITGAIVAPGQFRSTWKYAEIIAGSCFCATASMKRAACSKDQITFPFQLINMDIDTGAARVSETTPCAVMDNQRKNTHAFPRHIDPVFLFPAYHYPQSFPVALT